MSGLVDKLLLFPPQIKGRSSSDSSQEELEEEDEEEDEEEKEKNVSLLNLDDVLEKDLFNAIFW